MSQTTNKWEAFFVMWQFSLRCESKSTLLPTLKCWRTLSWQTSAKSSLKDGWSEKHKLWNLSLEMAIMVTTHPSVLKQMVKWKKLICMQGALDYIYLHMIIGCSYAEIFQETTKLILWVSCTFNLYTCTVLYYIIIIKYPLENFKFSTVMDSVVQMWSLNSKHPNWL